MATFIGIYAPHRDEFALNATPEEQEAIGRHFEYLRAAHSMGDVAFVGLTDEATPMGVAVIDVDGIEAAQVFFRKDPAVTEGVFSVEVKPFKVVFERPRD